MDESSDEEREFEERVERWAKTHYGSEAVARYQDVGNGTILARVYTVPPEKVHAHYVAPVAVVELGELGYQVLYALNRVR